MKLRKIACVYRCLHNKTFRLCRDPYPDLFLRPHPLPLPLCSTSTLPQRRLSATSKSTKWIDQRMRVLSRSDLASNLPLNRRQHMFFRVQHRAVTMVRRRSARRPSSPNGRGKVTRAAARLDAASRGRGHWPWSSCCHDCGRSGR
jgi:hypothetical protein